MTPEDKAKHAAYMREYTARNADKINARRRARRSTETLDRERAWRAANPDKSKEYDRRYEAKNPDKVKDWKHASAERNREKKRSRQRERYALNLESERERSKRRYRENPDKIRDQARQRRLKDPHRHWLRTISGVQNAMARNAGVSIERIDWDAVLVRDSGICGICNLPVAPTDLTFDHIQELACGGPHCMSNIQVAHRSCNAAKSNTAEGRKRRTKQVRQFLPEAS